MKNNIFNLLICNLKKAFMGRQLWIKLVKRYNIISDDYIVLMPSLNRDYNYYSLLYMNQFLQNKKYNKVIILTFDNRVIKSYKLFSDKITLALNVSQKNLDLILKYYCLYKFTDKLIIISLDKPKGRNDYNLVGKNGITTEELISIGVYGNKKFIHKSSPKYDGKDKDILSFIYKKVV